MSKEKGGSPLSSMQRRTSTLELGSYSFTIESVEDIDRLIDSMTEKDFQNNDEVFPYWAQLWPSAVGLSRFLLTKRPFSHGLVLDLGCGLGLTTLAARVLADRVVAFDYCRDALHFCRENLKRNNLAAGLLRMHWSRPALRGGFDAIIGSDILYEQRAVKPVADMVENLLSPNGKAFISTPNRPAVGSFIGEMEARGFLVKSSAQEVVHDGARVEITILWLERSSPQNSP